jgi:hypothetical protein
MQAINWDPLEASLTSEVFSATIKRQIKNILKSYTGWFDPFAEMIQNSLDAVDNRKRREADHTPRLWIQIDLKENTISITDNGVGFSEDQFKSFLAPNVSFKGQQDRGNKGVGATYLAYGFNFLEIGTKTPDFSFVGTIKGGREWVEDDSGTKIRPKIIQQSQSIHHIFAEIDRGTTFTLKLVGEYIRPRDLKWVGATTAEQWEVVLRTKTPLGGIYWGHECLLSGCQLIVIDETGSRTEKEIVDCQYLYPHQVMSMCKELKDIKKAQQKLISKGKDASVLPASFYRLNGLYNFWTSQEVVADTGEFKGELNLNEMELARKYRLSVYGFFGYSTDIWDKYNDDIARLRKGTRILKGGLQLATNCMPQGELLIIPLTKNVWYQNVTHVIAHFEAADPDLGRKGFQPELQQLAQHVAAGVVKRFQSWKKLLKKETGAPPDILAGKNIHDWIRDQEDHEKNNPLTISRQDVFLPTKEPAITSKPLNEQDVIALFNQLLAGGVIRGVKVLATSQHQQYDGIYRFCLKEPFDNHIFDKSSNPLGMEKSAVSHAYLSAPGILEYKYSFDALIEEIEKGVKNERQINLVIAWEMGKNWPKRYQVTPLLHLDNLQHRYFHGGTHIVKDASTGDIVFPAIILSELVDYVNDPDDVQDYQRTTYMEL